MTCSTLSFPLDALSWFKSWLQGVTYYLEAAIYA